MAIKQFLEGVGLVMLFAICCMIFLVGFINQNNEDAWVTNDTSLNNTLNSFKARASDLNALGTSSAELLVNDQPSAAFLFLIIKNAFYIPIAFIVFAVSSIGTLTTAVFSMFFGVGSSPFYIVFGVVIGIALLGVVLGVLKIIRTGEGER